ncbi:cysteine hydrolase family protein [Streptomyces sp. 7N604]|uniref:cysteine hydrolase family protein n=1 Tax=Streptomyces sp. 7N604 TaxID=3457415 RepID=UPI003FD26650
MENSETGHSRVLDVTAALIVVDVQKGFGDAEFWGVRNNPAAEANVASLLAAWQDSGRPVVFVRHDSAQPDSPLWPGQPGNDFQEFVAERRGKGSGPELLVTKSVNSAFYGEPDLDAWLRGTGSRQIVVAGIQTNMCAETTARMGGNLGYEVLFALDATYTFGLGGPYGWRLSADELARATAVSLHGGGFAEVVATEELVRAARPTRGGGAPPAGGERRG